VTQLPLPQPARKPHNAPEDYCPNGCGLLNESVSANTTGNDELVYCEQCGYHVESWTPYAHNDPTSHRFKGRHGSVEVAEPEPTKVEPVPGPNPSGLCHCGCGARAPIATHTNRAKGHIKGLPMRFVMGHGRRKAFGRF
jgi:hypothetical protein